MSSVNRAIILGNIGKDPELRHMPGGQPVCDLSIATTEKWTDKSGEKKEQTEWHKVVCFGKTAENCVAYLRKGRQVFVEGKIRTRKWKDKEGHDRYTTEVIANHVTFIGGKREEEEPKGAEYTPGMSDSDVDF